MLELESDEEEFELDVSELDESELEESEEIDEESDEEVSEEIEELELLSTGGVLSAGGISTSVELSAICSSTRNKFAA